MKKTSEELKAQAMARKESGIKQTPLKAENFATVETFADYVSAVGTLRVKLYSAHTGSIPNVAVKGSIGVTLSSILSMLDITAEKERKAVQTAILKNFLVSAYRESDTLTKESQKKLDELKDKLVKAVNKPLDNAYTETQKIADVSKAEKAIKDFHKYDARYTSVDTKNKSPLVFRKRFERVIGNCLVDCLQDTIEKPKTDNDFRISSEWGRYTSKCKALGIDAKLYVNSNDLVGLKQAVKAAYAKLQAETLAKVEKPKTTTESETPAEKALGKEVQK